jgi:hypothetical protein
MCEKAVGQDGLALMFVPKELRDEVMSAVNGGAEGKRKSLQEKPPVREAVIQRRGKLAGGTRPMKEASNDAL